MPTPRTALAAATLALAPLPAVAEPATYVIDPAHVVVAFLVGHVGYSNVLGRFGEVQGSFVYDTETRALSDVEVTIGLASVDSDDAARDNHVRSADFLSAEAHPVMTFTADSGTPTSETTGTVEGLLTLRGETHPVTLDVTLNKIAAYPFGHRKETIGVSARATISRSDWGMTYGVDNGLVGDEVQIILEVEALRED